MTTKNERRKLHQALNDLTKEQVAAIVRQTFPRVKNSQLDTLAKAVVAGAHKMISPRKIPRG